MESLAAAWQPFVSEFQGGAVASVRYLGISPFHFVVALNNVSNTQAYMLRLAINYEIHWLRLFMTNLMLVGGGGSLVNILLGNPIPIISDVGIIPSAILANLLMFHCPGDLASAVYTLRQLRPLWHTVNILNLALSATGAIELARGMFPTLPGISLVFLAILGATGGALVMELSNILLLPLSTYKHPRDGPSVGAVQAMWISVCYLWLRSFSASTIPVIGAAVSGLPFVSALPLDTPNARAVTFLVMLLASFTIPGGRMVAMTSSLLTSIPGFKPVCVPGAMGSAQEAPAEGLDTATGTASGSGPKGAAPWPLDAGLFGYEFNPEEDMLDEVVEAALPYLLASDDEEGDDDGDTVEAASPKARAPAAAAAPASAGKSARSATPQPRRRGAKAGSAQKSAAKRR